MSLAVARGNALTALDLAPSKPHASAWNGHVQPASAQGTTRGASREISHLALEGVSRMVAR
jgi:hypothetical protein